MILARPRRGVFGLATALLFLAPPALAQEGKSSETVEKAERVEGVILRVEPVGESKDDKAPKRMKVTLNTAVVWRDWSRDQADFAAKPDAKEGLDSVGTKGQPESPSTTFTTEVGPQTRVMLRYRSSTDAVSDGERTVEKAEKKDGSPQSKDVKTSPGDDKAPKMTMKDLKPGLFVEIDAKKGQAGEIVVLKPVGGPQTPASEAAPKATSSETAPK